MATFDDLDHLDAQAHVRGRSRYVDDEPRPEGLLFAAVLPSPVAHGKIRRLDTARAARRPGVRGVLTADDIPGENQIGSVLSDEPLLALDDVHYLGQPIALVVADDALGARHALRDIELEIDPLEVIVDPRRAYDAGHLIAEPQTLERGDVDGAFGGCYRVLEGRVEVGGQEHVYLETQRARAIPEEGRAMRILSSTQGPYLVQKTVARILGVAEHEVEVDVKRLGGGFGGKEDQATPWACLAALGAVATGRPVELVLSRAEDLMMTGKRHPYSADYRIGVSSLGQIEAFEGRYFQNAGAACDLSLAVLGRTLFHATNSYDIPHVRVWGAPCRTNIPPSTAFRGFGGPQGLFVIESAVTRAAESLGIDRESFQRRNLLSAESRFPYGQSAETVTIERCWDELDAAFDLADVRRRIDAFNLENVSVKKGFAVMPVTFGISFTATFLNQAGALLHVYTDGSVSVTTGGVEMGQGLFANMASVAARTLGIDPERIRIESTNTRRIANMSASAASSTTLLNGNATRLAAEQVRGRLLEHAAELHGGEAADYSIADGRVLRTGEAMGQLDWNGLVKSAYFHRVALSAHGFYRTPVIHFDAESGRGHPFAYHVCGAALVEVTVDGWRGTYDIDAVRLVHDVGRPLNRRVDLGQVEGGLVQGLGWMTVEDLRFDGAGRNLSGALATYKVPDVELVPRELDARLLEDDGPGGPGSEPGPYRSKAVGEPPLMYGLGVVFALRSALRALKPDRDFPFVAPMTPERVFMQLHGPVAGAGGGAVAAEADDLAEATPASAETVGV
ncbi:MAG: molybdopterin cofactor-binding domain-containing protein [Acidobacteriota bacterium]